jgi:metal-dependent amidase/aminoacylase/carboxypeptidase family protein
VRQAHLQSLFDLDQKFADVVSLDEAVAYFRTVKRSPATSPGLGKRTRGQDAPGVDPRSESLVFQTFVDDVLRAVHATPELTFEEVQTAALLSERLESLEARIRTPVEGLPTCFRAEVGSEDGPKVGIVVPLDAVPMHVGGSKGEPFDAIRPVHACGHQVIAAAVLGAVQLLSASSRPLQGCLVVMGIPGDEIHAPQVRAWGGGKALTAQAGAWDDLDAVLYAHPEFLDTVWGSSRWMSRQCIRLQGRRALGGDGRNVETVFAELLRASRTLAQRYGSEWIVIEAASFEGDVEDGSPCGAEVSILVYGHESEELRERLAALRDLVQEAGNGTDLAPQVAQQGPIYEGLLPNEQLRSAIASAFGDSYVSASAELPFATDFGNLTRRIPGVLIGIGRPGGWRFHTEEAAEEFASRDGHEIAARLAHVLATSVPELLSDRELLARARAEFESRRAEA